MKKLLFCVVVFSLAAALGAQGTGREAAPGATLYVAVKNVKVKSASVFFAGIVGSLNLGDAVTLVRSGGKWVNVRGAAGLQGFAPADAFSTRRVLNTGANFSASEFAMAGKGFSGSLERLIRSSENTDYSGVDAMESRVIAPEELRAFLEEGRLALGE